MVTAWEIKEKPFCEGYLYDHEYANSITSLFIIFMGLYGLIFNTHPQIYIKHYYSLFIINGIGSAIFHWSLHKGWGLIDSFPMLILGYYGMFFSIDIIIHKKYFHTDKQLYLTLTSIASVITTGLLVFTLDYTALYGQQEAVFVIFFALPILFVVISSFIIWYVYYDQYVEQNYTFARMERMLIKALIIGVVTASGWLSTELLCEDYKIPRYLYFHTLWHFGFSYSMYIFLLYVIFIYSLNNNIKLRFKMSDNKHINRIFYVFPVLEYVPDEHECDNNNNNNENSDEKTAKEISVHIR